MARLVFGMNQSLDGYIDHMAFPPDAALFRHFIDMTRGQSGSLYGRRLYGDMSFWDGDDWNRDETRQTDDLRDFALAWRRMPKWVVSRSLTSVGPNATLIGGDVEAAVRRLKAEVAGEVYVGGPVLARSLLAMGLLDEVQIYLHPVILGAGRPMFPEPLPPLRLTDTLRIGDRVVRLSFVPA